MPDTPTGYEKRPLQSKKFIAFLVAELSWKLVIMLVVLVYGDKIPFEVTATLLSVCIIAGFLEVAYVAGQASLDKYVRVAEITGSVLGKHGTTQPSDKDKEKDK